MSSGKTCRVHYHQAVERTLKKSCAPLQDMTASNLPDGGTQDSSKVKKDSIMLPIGFSIRSISESHSEGAESFLSQVLETKVAPKYYLSKKACEGIIRRAKVRNKILPPLLKVALEDTLKAN